MRINPGWTLWIALVACSSPQQDSRESSDLTRDAAPVRGSADSARSGPASRGSSAPTAIADRQLTVVPLAIGGEWAHALATGERISLDTMPGGRDQWLHATLVRTPYEGSCLSGTHAVCGATYHLVWAGDEDIYSGYRLGDLGQVDSVQWLPRPDAPGTATIRFRVHAYPTYVHQYEPDLPRTTRWYDVYLEHDSMGVTGHGDSNPPAPVTADRACATGSPDAAWFCAVRVVDLTTDGVLDTVIIRAVGPATDSLRVTMTVAARGRGVWREQWWSSYMLVDSPDFPDGEQERAAYIRERLEQVLTGIEVQAFDARLYAGMADPPDSLVLRDPPRYQVAFFYGYETTVYLRWDDEAERFRLLWSCC